MIELKNESIIINGKVKLLLAGEIHYFRLPKSEWEDRIIKLKKAGCNTVASYIPWICHEMVEGTFDFGEERDNLDLDYFIQLCEKHELFFIPRPGPFIMAEMKNEGIPYWIYQKYPEAIPYGWDHNKATTATLDYLHPGYLESVKKWYQKVNAILKPHLFNQGGSIIAMQLDNEIGMLSWVSNTPELTDHVITLFVDWLKAKYSDEELEKKYHHPVNQLLEDDTILRSPRENYAGVYREDFGEFIRQYYAKYIAVLKEYAIEDGMVDIPYIINVHGTGGGRGLTYPIGISQLYKGYTQAADFLPGSDIYYGDLTMENFHDIYLGNAFMKAVNRKGQPYGSMEFNCGDGNFGDNYGGRLSTAAADLKLRLSMAQGNRFINHYLFAGGYNYEMKPAVHDGNNRVAFTGERHGFAAPISPEGEYNYTFNRLAESIKTCAENEAYLADAKEQFDLTYAFLPNYYMTEFAYPKSPLQKEIVANITRFRNQAGWDIFLRSILLENYRIQALNLLDNEINVKQTPTLLLTLSEYLKESIQLKLVHYLEQGGQLFIYGAMPHYDEQGNVCEILAQHLGMTQLENHYEAPNYFLSISSVEMLQGEPETRVSFAQTYEVNHAEIMMVEKESKKTCGFYKEVGRGKVIVVTNSYRGTKKVFRQLLEKLACSPQLTHDFKDHGIFMTSTSSKHGELIHLINLDDYDKTFNIYESGKVLYEDVTLPSSRGLMLPKNISDEFGLIVASNSEIIESSKDVLVLRGSHQKKWARIQTKKEIISNEVVKVVEEKQGNFYVVSTDPSMEMKIQFR